MNSTQVNYHINASRENVYHTILDANALAKWKVPAGMTCHVHEFDVCEGGAIRISLSYDEPTVIGKTNAHTDTYHGRFVKLVPNERIVEIDEFETTVPSLIGKMIITITLVDSGNGTNVIGLHENIPSGVSIEDNETGWRMAFEKLAILVEGR
jgi:uncharacterized protein YndB with AHSA1/START domain